MKGWVLYKRNLQELSPEAYEINRLTEVASREGIDLQVFKPEQFDLVVTREDRKSILVDGSPSPLPDFVLPRMGAGTTYFALAVILNALGSTASIHRLGSTSSKTSYSVTRSLQKIACLCLEPCWQNSLWILTW